VHENPVRKTRAHVFDQPSASSRQWAKAKGLESPVAARAMARTRLFAESRSRRSGLW
jgi:hypothetical protein